MWLVGGGGNVDGIFKERNEALERAFRGTVYRTRERIEFIIYVNVHICKFDCDGMVAITNILRVRVRTLWGGRNSQI